MNNYQQSRYSLSTLTRRVSNAEQQAMWDQVDADIAKDEGRHEDALIYSHRAQDSLMHAEQTRKDIARLYPS